MRISWSGTALWITRSQVTVPEARPMRRMRRENMSPMYAEPLPSSTMLCEWPRPLATVRTGCPSRTSKNLPLPPTT